jgi:small nuclear ribonucleoprotein
LKSRSREHCGLSPRRTASNAFGQLAETRVQIPVGAPLFKIDKSEHKLKRSHFKERVDSISGGQIMDKMQKPLDLLQRSLNKTILLRLRGNREVRGILRSYDAHLNLVLEDAEILGSVNGEPSEHLGKIVLRGDNVVLISPP